MANIMQTATRTDTEARLNGLLDVLILEEQVLLLAGANFWMTVPIERLGIPAIKVTDGPNGARGGGALVGGVKAACFPAGIALASLLRVLSSLPPGVTELGCHPASEPEAESGYAAERVQELEVLCDPRVQAAVKAEGIELRSFAGLPGARL